MDKKVDLSKMFVKLSDYDDYFHVSYDQFINDVAKAVIKLMPKPEKSASKKKVSKKKTSSKKTVNSSKEKLD